MKFVSLSWSCDFVFCYMTPSSSGDLQTMNFLCMDAIVNQRDSGSVFLFGKLDGVRCSITITGILRRMWAQPRPGKTVFDVYEEFNTAREVWGIDRFESKSKGRIVSNRGVWSAVEMLEIRYSFKHTVLPTRQGRTYSAMHGMHSDPLELFILGWRLKMPCGVEIDMDHDSFEETPIPGHDADAGSYKTLPWHGVSCAYTCHERAIAPCPVDESDENAGVVAFSRLAVYHQDDPKSNRITLGAVFQESRDAKRRKTFMYKTSVHPAYSDRHADMLEYLTKQLVLCDPDVIVVHSPPPVLVMFRSAGYLICDIRTAAINAKAPSTTFSVRRLKTGVLKRPGRIDGVLEAAHILLDVADKLGSVELAFEIQRITGSLWRSSLMKQMEYWLLHAFSRRHFVLPSPIRNTGDNYRVAGGHLMDPACGLYETPVVLLDFESMYPSIVCEYGLCLTNVNAWDRDPSLPKCTDGSVLPGLFSTILSRRKTAKAESLTATDAQVRAMLTVRQKALKRVANSVCGCLVSDYFRFQSKGLNSLITKTARALIHTTAEMATKEYGYSVIYGHTDSIMICNPTSTSLIQMVAGANAVCQDVNGMHKVMKLKVDGIFRKTFILAKNKYATLTVNDDEVLTLDTTGMDITKRSVSPLSKSFCGMALHVVFNEHSISSKVAALEHLLTLAMDRLASGGSAVEFCRVYRLSKNPDMYSLQGRPGFVSVALKRGGFIAGDFVSVVKSKDHPGEALACSADICIDKDWYYRVEIEGPVMKMIGALKQSF